VIPEFDAAGNLPPGIHEATLAEVRRRYASNLHRRRLFAGLELAINELQAAGCRRIYINGSFVTAIKTPRDFDCCWDPAGVDLDRLPPELGGHVRSRRAAQQARYMGDILPADAPVDALQTRCLEFFQQDKRTRAAKGIVVIALQAIQPGTNG
jgi:hypothetical protein